MEEAEAKEATVNSIIISNVTEKVLMYIQKNNPREKIKKLEFLYHQDEEEKYSLLLARIYNLKAKNVQNVMDVLNEIVEIFNVLDDTNLHINNLEKLIIMQEALPIDLAKEFKPRANIDPNAFYNEIKDTVTFYNYKLKRGINKPKNNPIVNEVRVDPMDLDNINNYKKKFCHICDITGHTTKECRYNLKTKGNHTKKNKNYKKNLSNIEKFKNLSHEDINNKFKDDMDSLEPATMDCHFMDHEHNSKFVRDLLETSEFNIGNVSPGQNLNVLCQNCDKYSCDPITQND